MTSVASSKRHQLTTLHCGLLCSKVKLHTTKILLSIPYFSANKNSHLDKTIKIEHVDPMHLLGVNNLKLNHIKKNFPKLKIMARGDEIKLAGSRTDIIFFEKKLELFLAHIEKYGKLTEANIDMLLGNESEDIIAGKDGEGVIVYGNGGLMVKAKTMNQRRMVAAAQTNDLVFAIGPAGTGKTYTAVALAVRALKNREVKKIIMTRPAVESGENLGFLPGDLKEKLDPYMQPLYDALRDMIPHAKLADYLEKKTIEIAPLAFMRGRTLDNAFVILDEAQNATEGQFKMFLTRMGQSAKFVVTGDITQVDLPRSQRSGLPQAAHLLKGIEGISFIYLDGQDVIRHKLVREILTAYDKENK